MSTQIPTADVIVVGGGLAGFSAAIAAARSGASVDLFEARSEPGGRARTDRIDGFDLNQGAHALYLAGPGRTVLRELGIRPRGGVPRQRGGAWLVDGQRVPFRHLSAIGGRAGLAAARALLSRRAAADAEGRSLGDWLDEHVAAAGRPFAEMLLRTTTYAADPAVTEASAALAQVRLGARGVRYLDGGWSTLVGALAARAAADGVRAHHSRITSVTPIGEVAPAERSVGSSSTSASSSTSGSSTPSDGRGRPRFEVHLADGTVVRAGTVVLAAGGPGHADGLLAGASPRLAGWAAAARPVRAHCLDVALRRVPRPRWSTTYSLDEPLYLVDHAVTARLAPAGGAVFHGLWYEPGTTPEVDPRERLEAALDVVQPGWRDEVVAVRHRRDMVVAHDRPRPDAVGAERPRVAVDDLPGLFVAGDWLTRHGLLADAALTSGRQAGEQAAVASPGRVHRAAQARVSEVPPSSDVGGQATRGRVAVG